MASRTAAADAGAVRDVTKIRNVSLVGHSHAGKTTLGEAILLQAGVTNRLGSVDEGTSHLDYDEESRERKHSIDSSVFYVEHDGTLINFVDTPGTPDYSGQAIASFMGVETALITINATTGINVNTRRMYQAAKDFGLARMVVITRMDAPGVDLEALYRGIQETFGGGCHAINLPSEKGTKVIDVLEHEDGQSDLLDVPTAHTELVDCIIETDDELMSNYMEGNPVPPEQLIPAIHRAVQSGHLIPVVFCDAGEGVGIGELLTAISTFGPEPDDGKIRDLLIHKAEGESERKRLDPDPAAPLVGQVFKVLADPKSNIKYSVARIFEGTITHDTNVLFKDERKGHRAGHLFKMQGGQHHEVPAAGPGDMVAFAKIDLKVGDMIWSEPTDGHVEPPKFPKPMYSLAIEPKSRGDVEKIGAALHRFTDEDPCFEYHRDDETHELLISGIGDQHLATVQSKMRRYFNLDVEAHQPKIPYRETIAGSVEHVEYTHKKQSGGAGQFGRVFIDMQALPRGEGYEFEDKIFGGAIDQQYRPAVDKGIQDQMRRGVIAGCPVVDVKVSLVDGKTHPVDSKDVAFQIAGREAFKKAFVQCKPILLEPIVDLEVTCPTEVMGDIQRDLASKRGQVEGQDVLPGGQSVVHAKVPLAEVAVYTSQLKSVTGGQGSYMMEFSHYDIVPPNVQQEIVKRFEAAQNPEAG